jgi:hypothetical protein
VVTGGTILTVDYWRCAIPAGIRSILTIFRIVPQRSALLIAKSMLYQANGTRTNLIYPLFSSHGSGHYFRELSLDKKYKAGHWKVPAFFK